MTPDLPNPPLRALVRPQVSIAICSYNHARFLDRAIRSAHEQSYPCEVVVVDDGSTDASPAVLDAWAGRVRVIHKANGGQISAYERAFAETRGEVLIFLDSDDYLHPDAVARVVDGFTDGVAKVHFRMRVVDADDRPVGVNIPAALARGDVLTPMLKTGVLYASAPGSGNAYRRDVLARLLPLPADPMDRHGADLFLIYGSAFFGQVGAVDDALGAYRVHLPGAEARPTLVFGNSEQRADAESRFLNRLDRFRGWIGARVAAPRPLPQRFLDFGAQKAAFAVGVLAGPPWRRWLTAWRTAPWVLRSVWGQPAYSVRKKVALTAWACGLPLLPLRLARPAARYVCNPASRGH